MLVYVILTGIEGGYLIYVSIGSMNVILTRICHTNQPNVARYTIHGSCGPGLWGVCNIYILYLSKYIYI